MTDEQEAVYHGWLGSLTREEQEEARYVAEMSGGSHATAYLAVGLMRLERRVAALEQRTVWKDGLKAAGAIVGMVVAGASALYAGLHQTR